MYSTFAPKRHKNFHLQTVVEGKTTPTTTTTTTKNTVRHGHTLAIMSKMTPTTQTVASCVNVALTHPSCC